MLKALFIYNGIAFGLSILPLVLLGHRVRRGHWALSLFGLVSVASASYIVLQVLQVTAPAQVLILAELLIGVGLIALIEDWNPLGHLTFWSLVMAAGSFLAFAFYVTFFAHLGPWSLTLSVLLLLLQAVTLGLMVAHTYEILDAVCRVRWRRIAHPEPTRDYFPKVSLHVPAHNEPPEMVKATLSALASLDYPNYEVVMVDDNTRDEALWRPVEEHCQKLGFKFFHLENWPGYKAGALNFALAHTDPAAEIVGVVDSDYVVEPAFLRDLVGLFRNPKVGFVQSPQDYRDFGTADIYEKACYDAYQYFFDISMASRNERNGIIYAGTMGLVRRQALEELGGWDEWCITEDAEISLRILDRGYDGLYVARTYGRGLMPLDYEGFKKQRFRWAFGGMQILRLHWRKLLPRWLGGDPRNRLSWGQKFAYVSGGLQWLNDPLNFCFTSILLIGTGTLALAGSLVIQPLVGAVIFFPLAFLVFGLLRFLWALRVRSRCSGREAYGALTIMLGLTWVVTLACLQGLTRREGVFLRTPKKRDERGLLTGLGLVGWELAIAGHCAAGMIVLLAGEFPKPVRLLLIILLGWQLFLYSSAVQSWLWSRRSEWSKGARPQLLPFRTAGHQIGLFVGESRAAVHVGVGVAVAVLLIWAGFTGSAELERIFAIMPDRSFVAQLVKQPASIEVKAIIYEEEETALGADVKRAVALWSEDGAIYDLNFTPDDPRDDRVWRGREAIRQRYAQEFSMRRYQHLAHGGISVGVEGANAWARNDLEAIIWAGTAVEHIRLQRSDRWAFRKEGQRWKIVSLTVNSVPR